MKNKIKNITICGISIIIIGFIIYLAILAWYPFKVIEYKNTTFSIDNNTIIAGQPLTFNMDFCKYKNIYPTVYPSLFNNAVIALPSYTPVIHKGCYQQKSSVHIPDFIPEGRYILRMESVYKINKLQERIIVVETEPFTIIQK